MKKLFTLFIFLLPILLFGQTPTRRQVDAAGTAITRLPVAKTTSVALTDTQDVFRNGIWMKASIGVIRNSIDSSVWKLSGNNIYNKNAGSVGIGTGTVTPKSLLEVNGGNILGIGTFGAGDTLKIAGAGTRLMWNPRKAAFRSGHVTGDGWDNVNVGDFSNALGVDAIASGQYSTAFGNTTLANGQYSTAFGFGSQALGIGSTAFGQVTNASGLNSTAFGYNTYAVGQYSTAFGYNTISSGDFSIAMGRQMTVSGAKSIGIGLGTASYNVSDTNVFSIMGGKLGVGTVSPKKTLDINGKSIFRDSIQIKDGTQGAGKVLTSDATGLATWSTLSGTTSRPNNEIVYGSGSSVSSDSLLKWSHSIRQLQWYPDILGSTKFDLVVRAAGLATVISTPGTNGHSNDILVGCIANSLRGGYEFTGRVSSTDGTSSMTVSGESADTTSSTKPYPLVAIRGGFRIGSFVKKPTVKTRLWSVMADPAGNYNIVASIFGNGWFRIGDSLAPLAAMDIYSSTQQLRINQGGAYYAGFYSHNGSLEISQGGGSGNMTLLGSGTFSATAISTNTLTATSIIGTIMSTIVKYDSLSTIVGWSSMNANSTNIWYQILDNHRVLVMWNLDGTSNSTSLSFTIPFTTKNNTNMIYQTTGTAVDGGAWVTNATRVYIGPNSNIIKIQKTPGNDASWTSTATEKATGGQLEIFVQ